MPHKLLDKICLGVSNCNCSWSKAAKQNSAGKAGELFYGGKEEGGKESVENPSCIPLKGKENWSSCKGSGLSRGCWAVPTECIWFGVEQADTNPSEFAAGLSVTCCSS